MGNPVCLSQNTNFQSKTTGGKDGITIYNVNTRKCTVAHKLLTCDGVTCDRDLKLAITTYNLRSRLTTCETNLQVISRDRKF